MIAIITARGGSKRIPRKNLRPFCGKPIIAYSIAAALASELFEEVMVSTDDQEIASVARELGASVPFMRSARTSDDFATTADVLAEVIEQYHARGRDPAVACCIYPTAPFVTGERLREGHALLMETGADAVLPITRFGFPIWRSFRREGERVFYNWPEHAPRRSQDLPPAYHDAGQFYFFRPAIVAQTGQFLTENTVGLEISELEVQDIDSQEDWALAELKFTQLRSRSAAPGGLST